MATKMAVDLAMLKVEIAEAATMEMYLARHYDTHYGYYGPPIETLFAGAVLSMALFTTCFLAWKAIEQLREANMKSAGQGRRKAIPSWLGRHRGHR